MPLSLGKYLVFMQLQRIQYSDYFRLQKYDNNWFLWFNFDNTLVQPLTDLQKSTIEYKWRKWYKGSRFKKLEIKHGENVVILQIINRQIVELAIRILFLIDIDFIDRFCIDIFFKIPELWFKN